MLFYEYITAALRSTLNYTILCQVWNFCSQPGSKSQTKSVSNAEMRTVLRPQRFKVHRQTNFTTSIHLCSLPFQLWYFNLWGSHRIRCWYIKLKVKLVLDQIMNIPTLAFPMRPLLVTRFNRKPVQISCFPNLNILDQ